MSDAQNTEVLFNIVSDRKQSLLQYREQSAAVICPQLIIQMSRLLPIDYFNAW